ncbi:hypothetical protein MIND_01247800 [Mycena indigotica]|uniref:Uncharacterized protein n=1 Tax=Mycena indigotica TaxID=2126181 RepID=A0A8H6S2V2_9AGAR|nr:uncharacterized protein MIND_01247800 [Mycena indigotica]KAF7292205.1 hypothetical protein MIND_01247800 [Mycena indigotica]
MAPSKQKTQRRAQFKLNLSQVAKRTIDAVLRTPSKIRQSLSPRKKARHDENTARESQDTRSVLSDWSKAPASTHDTNHDPLRAYTNVFELTNAIPNTPSAPPMTFSFTWMADSAHIGRVDPADPFRTLCLPHTRNVTMEAPKVFTHNWKPPSVEEVPEDDDCMSISTFPQWNSHYDHRQTLVDSEISPMASHAPTSCDGLSDADRPSADDCDALDEFELAEYEAEMRSGHTTQVDYPRPAAPAGVLNADSDGICRRPPKLEDARAALKKVQAVLRGAPRGNQLFGKAGVGYKDCHLDPFSHTRLVGIRALLCLYTDENSLSFMCWGDSMLTAAISMGKGKYCARILAILARQYIIDGELLELNPYGKWTDSILSDEDLTADLLNFLQLQGKNITAQKLHDYLCSADVKARHGIETDISLATATRYLQALGYRFSHPKTGQYFALQAGVWVYDNDGLSVLPTPPGQRTIIWYHDESVFYAHDRRRKTWYHKDENAKPYRKGEGQSFMVADFFSADFGWLRNPWTGESARRCIHIGVNKDGYFTNIEVREQAKSAVKLVQELWPEYKHVFIYDNATTHRKRPEGALTAIGMPKGPSGQTQRNPQANFLAEINLVENGKIVYDHDRKPMKTKIEYQGAKFADGTPQDLYHRTGPMAGKFKGMQRLLEERGLPELANLRAQCGDTLNKCNDKSDTGAYCCRRALFNQPDFVNIAWAAKKYHGHRTFPSDIMDQLVNSEVPL